MTCVAEMASVLSMACASSALTHGGAWYDVLNVVCSDLIYCSEV